MIGDVRAEVFARARNRCEWPQARVEAFTGWRVVPCGRPAAELAHLHSRGMGGNPGADTTANTMAACAIHARTTDGEGSVARLETIAMFEVVGYDWHPDAPGSLAWHRAEALTEYLGGR